LAPDGDEQSTSCPGHITPRKELWYPFNRMGGPQNCSGHSGERKILSLPGFDGQIIQPAA